MRARDVLGKRIVGIEQWRFSPGRSRSMCTNVHCFVLEDGTRISPITIETDHGWYAHEFAVSKPNKPKRRRTKGNE